MVDVVVLLQAVVRLYGYAWLIAHMSLEDAAGMPNVISLQHLHQSPWVEFLLEASHQQSPEVNGVKGVAAAMPWFACWSALLDFNLGNSAKALGTVHDFLVGGCSGVV